MKFKVDFTVERDGDPNDFEDIGELSEFISDVLGMTFVVEANQQHECNQLLVMPSVENEDYSILVDTFTDTVVASHLDCSFAIADAITDRRNLESLTKSHFKDVRINGVTVRR